MGTVSLVVGNAAPQTLTADCASDTWNPDGSTTALGYVMSGGPPPGVSNLALYGCASTAANALGVSVQADQVTGPGTFTNGSAVYTDSGGEMWMTTGAFKLVITQLDASGGIIDAKLTASVVHPPSQVVQSISATFAVCHIPDELAP